jgi:superfamily II DNA or RNA helicase
MDLSRRLAGEFSDASRNRGRIYLWEGRVRIQHGSADHVDANVRGTRRYEVSLDWADGVLYAMCDCPRQDTGDPCKHVWATILASDQRGYLSAVTAGRLSLDYGGFGEEEFGLSPRSAPLPRPVPPPAWKNQIMGIASRCLQAAQAAEEWPARREILYVVDVAGSQSAGAILLRLETRDRKADGGYGRTSPLNLKRSRILLLPQAADREIVAALAGAAQYQSWSYGSPEFDKAPDLCTVWHPLAGTVLPLAIATGRCYLRQSAADPDNMTRLSWDGGGTWTFGLELRPSGKTWALTGILQRGEERMDLAAPVLITRGGFVLTEECVAPLAEDAAFDWIFHLCSQGGSIQAAAKDRDDFLEALLSAPDLPPLDVPEELRYREVTPAPRPGLRILGGDSRLRGSGKLQGELSFDYDGRTVSAEDPARGFFNAEERCFARRDAEAEKTAAALLSGLGLRRRPPDYWHSSPGWELAPTKLPRVVRALVDAGWHIEAEGKVFRRPGAFRIEVSTGVDWFELHGGVEYGETSAKLPELLEALRRGENMVRLGDGTYGVLPEEWLERFQMIARAGTPEEGHLKFRASQAGLLDALLATQPEARCDEAFARLREELRGFQGVEAPRQPAGFVGSLREYQREGLGWMEFLRRFSFGGCLADDMGVGKTAQVLALLETRRVLRAAGEPLGPSLVVVPRSLVFNWKQEAERFTPQLRVLDYTGVARNGNGFDCCDIVLTTYGTLRRDAVRLKDVEFDYIVLDEAQAVKNAATESAKATRLLRGRHRLALSGTPVENHLGELWSLFEFLNPGMLGAAGVFKLTAGSTRCPDEDARKLLAHALRPFILRRTKQQVARELPEKTEQTVYCEMEPAQRKLYNELREHYRNTLLKRIETQGLAKSKILVLEALLRLRQAACHPGLLDPKRKTEPSAKLDVLLAQLEEVIEEGHKALVFSQFTSLLDIVRGRLDHDGVVYEYLDGATRDRQARVERFQNDPNCPLFLVSLKAGGLGLNLTAAEYVFLLDPWWNPAVEAQAVDRAHRIGQTRQVFAYRLIARDTVEEKVLELQKSKRDLAAAIIGEDNSLIRDLRREDLELLLS